MFKQTKPNLVESDEGFSVQTTGWTGMIYTQGEKTLYVDSEYLLGPTYNIMIGASGIKKWNSGEEISEFERDKIVDNIIRAFHFRKLKVAVK